MLRCPILRNFAGFVRLDFPMSQALIPKQLSNDFDVGLPMRTIPLKHESSSVFCRFLSAASQQAWPSRIKLRGDSKVLLTD